MNSRRKLQREVRNGKAVYIPAPARSQPRLQQVQSAQAHSVPPRPRKAEIRLSRLLVLGSFGIALGLLWISAEYLSNPDVAFWLDYGLLRTAHSRHSSEAQPLELSKIQSAIKAEGFVAGQLIVLKQDFTLRPSIGTAADIAIPVFKSNAVSDSNQTCSQPCSSIQQLRIYRSLQLPFAIRLFQSDPYFRLTDVIAVQGPSESDLRSSESNPLLSLGSDQALPLTQSELYDPAPRPGQWLRLVGLQNQGNSVSTYGQVYYFNPRQENLVLMLNWVSPLGEVPQWLQVTGDGEPELVINQTVGLEPQYKVYQIQKAEGVARQLQAIFLNEPAFENISYTNALSLARNGLWTPAEALLKQVKQDNPKSWSNVAQNQLDFIHLHASVTQAQAAQSSASGVQRILGYLINGSWTAALDVLQSDRSLHPELREMLLSDTGRLANRIETALKLTPGNPDIVAWGALLRLSQGSEQTAMSWTQRQIKGPEAVAKVQKILKLMRPPAVQPPKAVKPKPTQTTIPAARPTPVESQIPISPSPTTSPLAQPQPAQGSSPAGLDPNSSVHQTSEQPQSGSNP